MWLGATCSGAGLVWEVNCRLRCGLSCGFFLAVGFGAAAVTVVVCTCSQKAFTPQPPPPPPPFMQLDVEVLRADSTEHLTITLEASA